MTIIVAARTKSGVTLAADTQTSAGSQKLRLDRSKLWSTGFYAIGACGSLRVSQIIRHHATWPKYRPDEDTDIEAFCVKQLVPAIRTAAKDQGVKIDDANHIGSDLLVAWGTNVVEIDGNGSVCIPSSGATAIGSGWAEAAGYLGNVGPWTTRQVIDAATRSTITNTGCSAPIHHMDTTSLTVTTENAS
jgi:ATP-dependent protease HslVU (ClpYQ) peptidase subunit